jgi:hypothetical protein
MPGGVSGDNLVKRNIILSDTGHCSLKHPTEPAKQPMVVLCNRLKNISAKASRVASSPARRDMGWLCIEGEVPGWAVTPLTWQPHTIASAEMNDGTTQIVSNQTFCESCD